MHTSIDEMPLSPSRRPSLATVAALVLALGACGDASDGSTGSHEPLNLILISLDTCRADRLSCYGAERENTPHLDALARESVVFTDCQAQSSSTGPSHLSIFTGQQVQRHGLLKNGETSIPAVTLASVLGDGGYATAAFTGHGSLQGKFGHGVGFDVFVSWPPGSHPSPTYQRHLDQTVPEGLAWIDGEGGEGGEGGEAGEPFFLLVHGYDPHLPFWPEEPWHSDFAGWYQGDLDIRLLRKRTEFHPLFAEGKIGEDEVRYLKDLYDGEIASADEAIGGFLDELRRRDVLDRSILVFTSDHGETIGDHDWVGHGVFWQEVLHVPLMIRFPGGKWARSLDVPVQHIDILPTLLSALGHATPDGVQGSDLMPLIRGEIEALPPRMRIGRRALDVAVRFDDEPRWKIVFKDMPPGQRQPINMKAELYDLEADPEELDNLAEHDRDRFRELYARYNEWRREAAREDPKYRGAAKGMQREDLDMLRALGYVGDDEEPEEADR